MELADRISLILEKSRKTQAEFARDVGIDPSSVSQILRRKRKTVRKSLARKISEAYNCDYDWIMSGVGDPPEELKPVPGARQAAGEKSKETVEVEILTLAGLGDLYDLQNHEPIEVTQLAKDLVINVGRETRTAIRCKGDSMSPTILNDALVGVDFNDREPVDNGIFLLRFRDLGLAIKRLRFRTDGYLIVADNPTVEDEFIPRERLEEGLILGRVRWIYNKV